MIPVMIPRHCSWKPGLGAGYCGGQARDVGLCMLGWSGRQHMASGWWIVRQVGKD